MGGNYPLDPFRSYNNSSIEVDAEDVVYNKSTHSLTQNATIKAGQASYSESIWFLLDAAGNRVGKKIFEFRINQQAH
jgi:hypothetical protein